MPIQTLRKIGDLMVANWRVVAAVAGLVTASVAAADAITTIKRVPVAIEETQNLLRVHNMNAQVEAEWAHNTFGDMANKNSPFVQILVELRRNNQMQQQQLCLQIASLRKTDWTRCLVPTAIAP